MIAASRQYTWLRLSILGTGLALMAAMAATAWRLGPIGFQSLFPTRLTCGCLAMAIRPSWWLSTLAVLAAGLGLAVLLRFVWVLGRQWYRGWSERRRLGANPSRGIIHQTTGVRYTLVATEEPVAVTIGFLRPNIVLSDGLIHRLSGSEVTAVLRHELAHQRAFDPLMTALMTSATAALTWLPWMRTWLAAAYSWRELAADGVATENYRQTTALSGAFVKLVGFEPQPELSAFSPNADRLEKLLNHRWEPSRRIWSWSAALSVAGIILTFTAMGRLAKASTTSVPPVAAALCHETRVMCRAEWTSFKPAQLCSGGRCISTDQRLTSVYAITLGR